MTWSDPTPHRTTPRSKTGSTADPFPDRAPLDHVPVDPPTAHSRLPTAATVSPVRLRLSRKAGFRLQAHSLAVNGLPAVNVARPGKWGNPFTIRQAIEAGYIKRASEPLASQFLVECFEDWLLDRPDHMWTGPARDEARRSILSTLDDLRGKNIACWCAPGAPCHGDVLLELASRLVCEEVKS